MSRKSQHAARRCSQFTHWFVVGFAIATASMAGCNRAYYRQQADCDAYALIQEKTCQPDWPLDGYTIEVDPMSRMYDPFCPDCPPMPPDDPASHCFMHCVDGKHGWDCWHANGNTDQVEGPNWEETLPRCDNGNVLIDETLAVQLAFLHSPEYQVELEELYLSALDVSFERFRFDTQFFGGTGLTFTADGRDRNGTGESSSLLDLSSRNVQASRLFASGGELVVGLANSLLWQFAGPNTNAATTLLDFSFVQPLLRMGGRDFVLERLTIAERALLANVRQMERFRRGFYMQVITGRNAGQGPSRRGGIFGGSGLEGFTGVGGGGFGQLGGGGAGGFTGGAGAGQAGGFLGLLQTQQDLRNQQGNIAALESSVAQLDAFFRAGRIDYFQVELARQALFNAQSRLLNSQLTFAADKDDFKLQLGLAPHIVIELDDELIEPFQLVDAQSVALQNELTLLQRKMGQAVIEIIQIAADSEPDQKKPSRVNANDDGDSGANQDNADKGSADTDTRPDTDEEMDSAIDAAIDGDARTGRRGSVPANGVYAASYLQDLDLEMNGADSHDDSDSGERDEKNNLWNPDSSPQAQSSGEDEDDPPGRQLKWTPKLRQQLATVKQLITQAKSLCERANQDGLPRASEDIARLESSLARRKTSMQRLRELLKRRLAAQADTCDDKSPPALDVDSIIPFDPSRLTKLPGQLEATSADIEKRFKALAEELATYDEAIDEILQKQNSVSPNELYKTLTAKVFSPAPNALNELSANLLSLTLVQVRARTQNASLVPVEMDWHSAVDSASVHRRDWMNARASLVDTWRLIQFNANALESDLNFIFNGDISNVGDNPLDLRGSTGRLQVGLEFDAPITRLSERNTYRQALIEYQQARRTYYQAVDRITNGLRGLLRGLEINQVNFELRRAAVEVAIAQVELARLRLQEPPKPDEPANLGATTARDLVSALSDLLNVQNDFLSVWVNHESLRRSLDFDLGTMQLDASYNWIDPGPIYGATMTEDLNAPSTEFPEWSEDGITVPETVTDELPNEQFELMPSPAEPPTSEITPTGHVLPPMHQTQPLRQSLNREPHRREPHRIDAIELPSHVRPASATEPASITSPFSPNKPASPDELDVFRGLLGSSSDVIPATLETTMTTENESKR